MKGYRGLGRDRERRTLGGVLEGRVWFRIVCRECYGRMGLGVPKEPRERGNFVFN